MHTVLWLLQIVLALKFCSTAYTHGLRTAQAEMRRGAQRLGASGRSLLWVSALCLFVGGACLVLPAATGILPWLTPWAAAVLALMMGVGIGLHVACREKPRIGVGLVLVALAAFVAYGRWALAPL